MLRFLKWLVNLLEPKKDVCNGFAPKREITLSEENCLHLTWEPESKENGWRSYCHGCGLKAAGSCQA